MPRRPLLQGVYTRDKYLCTKLGVKDLEGGGHLLKGGAFSGAYSILKWHLHYHTLVLLFSALLLDNCMSIYDHRRLQR